MDQRISLFGLVTRVENGRIYVWSTSHRLSEAITYECRFPNITAGDVVQYKLSRPLEEIQENMELTKVPNHDLTILYPPLDSSQFRVRTTILFPPENSNFYDEQYNYFKTRPIRCKLKFMAFSLEFGAVASFVDLAHEPGKAYKSYVARLPPKFDMLKKYIDTIFCVVEAELKEVTTEHDLEEIRNRAVSFKFFIQKNESPWKAANNSNQFYQQRQSEDRQKHVQSVVSNVSMEPVVSNTPKLIMSDVLEHHWEELSPPTYLHQQNNENISPSSDYNSAPPSIVNGSEVNWGEPLDEENIIYGFDENESTTTKLKLKKVSWSDPIEDAPLFRSNEGDLFSDVSSKNSLLRAIDANCRQFDSSLRFSVSTRNASVDNNLATVQFNTGLEAENSCSNKMPIHSMTAATVANAANAVVCYCKSNYALLYSPSIQSLAILMNADESLYQIGYWVEGTDAPVNKVLLQNANLPGFAKNIKYQFTGSRMLKTPCYPTRSLKKIYTEIGVPDSKPQTASSVQIRIRLDLETVERIPCGDGSHCLVLTNTGIGKVLVNGPTPILDPTEGTVEVWIEFIATQRYECHWKFINDQND